MLEKLFVSNVFQKKKLQSFFRLFSFMNISIFRFLVHFRAIALVPTEADVCIKCIIFRFSLPAS